MEIRVLNSNDLWFEDRKKAQLSKTAHENWFKGLSCLANVNITSCKLSDNSTCNVIYVGHEDTEYHVTKGGSCVNVVSILSAQDDGCDFNGVMYKDGESFKDAEDCNDCFCAGGAVACTLKLCINTGKCHTPHCRDTSSTQPTPKTSP